MFQQSWETASYLVNQLLWFAFQSSENMNPFYQILWQLCPLLLCSKQDHTKYFKGSLHTSLQRWQLSSPFPPKYYCFYTDLLIYFINCCSMWTLSVSDLFVLQIFFEKPFTAKNGINLTPLKYSVIFCTNFIHNWSLRF